MKEFKKIVTLLEELHKEYPSYSLGRHISSATSDYGDVWGITDKEFLFALTKYKSLLEMDADQLVSDEYIKQIQQDAENLLDFTDEEEED